MSLLRNVFFFMSLFITSLSIAMEKLPQEQGIKLALFVSTDFEHMQAVLNKKIPYCTPQVVISNIQEARGIAIAKERGITTEILPKEKVPFARDKNPDLWDQEDARIRQEYCARIMDCLERHNVTPENGLLGLARFMIVLSPNIVKKFKGRIINIHPSLLPSFKGLNGVQQAFDYGVKIAGPTTHFVDEGLDTGQIIKQEPFPIEESDTIENVRKKMKELGCRIFSDAIKLFVEGRLQIDGCKVHILSKQLSRNEEYDDYSD